MKRTLNLAEKPTTITANSSSIQFGIGFENTWEAPVSPEDQADAFEAIMSRLEDPIYQSEEDSNVEFAMGKGKEARQRVAEKVVASALMRIAEGLPSTDLRLEDGKGVCSGTGMRIAISSAILIGIGGDVWDNYDKTDFTLKQVDVCKWSLPRHFDLMRKARRQEFAGMTLDMMCHAMVADLEAFSNIARLHLMGNQEFVERVGCVLARRGYLSAAQFEFLVQRDRIRKSDAMSRGGS